MHVHVCTCKYTCTCTCMWVYMYMYLYVSIHVLLCKYTCTYNEYTCTCMWVYMYMYVSILYMYMYLCSESCLSIVVTVLAGHLFIKAMLCDPQYFFTIHLTGMKRPLSRSIGGHYTCLAPMLLLLHQLLCKCTLCCCIFLQGTFTCACTCSSLIVWVNCFQVSISYRILSWIHSWERGRLNEREE